MLSKIIHFSVKHKFIVFLLTFMIVVSGFYSLTHIPIGAVPDITNNQVQILTTTRDMSTEDVEQFITYPVELEMGNLPGIEEIRSISKFGLSVVTLVFKDEMGTYLPRQLIAEKLRNLGDKLPEGINKPEMGPISTGLGEIYQYTLEVKPQYKDKYSLMDLRTIQDWIVKRNLTGIPGVVEVNTWGGKLKQFEVKLNPEKLKALNISVSDVYKALKDNNGIAGGGYIEKANKSYFIRSDGLIRSLDDIKNIEVLNRGGVPVYVKDVGDVGYGFATRFGAITGNGEGEKVMGQIMMLKGANVSEVIKNVKERVAQVSKSLPEGVYINPFLERTELLNKTTFTIAENLILGSIIVILVVLLLLGNWRSALIISSVIPLSLLFALTLMYIFGIDANLMSLGAIDFGIIIDGAVIIVEFIAFKIAWESAKLLKESKEERQEDMDEITYEASSKMMHSAIFGQMIIIIVFLPILALTGVEGKMFRPMALVFIFALTGVMILGMTYIPAISALLLRPKKSNKKNISDKLIEFLNGLYEPTLRFALSHKKLVLSIALILLFISAYTFSKMGGEFVPTLDEGDFVIQPVLKSGTSLKKTIETTTKIEKILKSFPEVEQVVSRIGAAEVPTDPMSMEDADVIVKLKPKSEWKTAQTKDGLIEKIKDSLSILPGIEFEFTQPIEMRFNELISGTRSDIAVKIYGEDLNLLHQTAMKIKAKIDNIPGAADVIVEKTEGLPQLNIKIQRDKLAKYGVSVDEVNSILSIAMGGLPAGEVFEGEKRFDLTARFDSKLINDIDAIKNIPVITQTGETVPFKEVAEIKLEKGPAKISRDATKRRIAIGINVRGRDLESVVKDIQQVIDTKIKLPPGYIVEYGGQFENLRSAKKRLMIVVPIALLLIFILLYFAFDNVKTSLMIYTAIPLSTIGGIFALWLRDMPFSISAGIGFIALFGIAVLNGIVLIEHYRELKGQGLTMNELIIRGSKERMRPVILTAMAAMMGFLPMAISQSAGAEVQRPLATVVIGGLFTSTFLTLIVLPVLYSIFSTPFKKLRMRPKKLTILILFFALTGSLQAQEKINADQLIEMALKNNKEIKAYELGKTKAKWLEKTAFEIDKTSVEYEYDPTNTSDIDGEVYRSFKVSQDFDFPSVYFARKKMLNEGNQIAEADFDMQVMKLKNRILATYENLKVLMAKRGNYIFLDSLYRQFEKAVVRKFELGESNALEKLLAQAQRKKIALQLQAVDKSIEKDFITLQNLVQTPIFLENLELSEPQKINLTDLDLENHPLRQKMLSSVKQSQYAFKTEKRKLLPGLRFGYTYGNTWQPGNDSYNAYMVGLKIPLFFGAQKNKAKAAKIAWQQNQYQAENTLLQLKSKKDILLQQLAENRQYLDYYSTEGKYLSEKLFTTAEKSYKAGEIDFFQYIQSLQNAMDIENEYLNRLDAYNKIVLSLNYLNINE